MLTVKRCLNYFLGYQLIKKWHLFLNPDPNPIGDRNTCTAYQYAASGRCSYNFIKGKLKTFLLAVILVFSSCFLYAQDTSLLHAIDDSLQVTKTINHVTGTFKGVYIINTQSVEAPAKNVLLFLVMHRFGEIRDGGYDLFGLDNATMRLGLDYGITNRLSVGIGRSTFEKTFDGHIKYKVLLQTDGSNKMPVTLDVFAGTYYTSLKYPDKTFLNGTYRTSYDVSLLIARKFSSAFSLQLTPSWLHYNLVPTAADNNDVFTIGLGGRMKITKRMSINFEYNYVPEGQINSYDYYNSMSLGLDIETGGHVFQLHITNSQGMVEPLFLGKTMGSWGKGNIYFGFNISRAFNLGRR